MLGGTGYSRGSSILLSGMSGTGKTSIAATLAEATCQRGERCQFFSFEESPGQIIRNMSSIGLNLQQWVKRGTAPVPNRAPVSLRPGNASRADHEAHHR